MVLLTWRKLTTVQKRKKPDDSWKERQIVCKGREIEHAHRRIAPQIPYGDVGLCMKRSKPYHGTEHRYIRSPQPTSPSLQTTGIFDLHGHMGGFVSKPDTSAKERSDEIDRQIEEDAKRFRRDHKVLLLASIIHSSPSPTSHSPLFPHPKNMNRYPGSGRSTIVKQFKIIHQAGFAPDELAMFISIIQRDVFDSAYRVVAYMKKAGLEYFEGEHWLLVEQIYTHVVPTPESLSPSSRSRSRRRSTDSGETLSSPRSWTNIVRATSFFDEVLRIGAPGYLPNETDVLRAPAKTVGGIEETRLSMGQLSISILEVNGVRGERKKWMHYFESVSTLLFVTTLSDYDQMLLEDKTQNHVDLSLLLFESVINNRWFSQTTIILFMNKIDVFKLKLNKIPLEPYFPEYTGGNDVNKAAKYLLRKFVQSNRPRLSLYPHLTQATDTSGMRQVFAMVKETILQKALNYSGIL
ncbi:hypothetical protein D9619_002297 [Psilocybe cf. subviscida]|uniref:G protein alpha subunit n=1 Tax=Psilocybe cf. subviscida TaxID=2480587 RepID=A0A8H5BGD0_9AGAR|nr:hypothetical protein D9619_002297 [Psilocybe cf. subviscida]